MKDIAVELVAIGLYLLVMQHCLAAFVFEKPDESWLGQAWHWATTRREAWWQTHVAATYNQSASAPEPTAPPSPEG